MKIPAVLSIAGSDSGGGAGIQADLKAFAACGVHGMTAITALTAQNTLGVDRVEAVSSEMILAQIKAVSQDIGIDAVKIGMLGNEEIVSTVAQALSSLPVEIPVVVDPVMISESGATLLDESAQIGLLRSIVPRATVITPNIHEAQAMALHGDSIPDENTDVVELARVLSAFGSRSVLITGGHRDEATDVLLDEDGIHFIEGERFPSTASHGSGCTHSSVIAARLALGDTILQAATHAKEIASQAVKNGLNPIGQGPGPVSVFPMNVIRATPEERQR